MEIQLQYGLEYWVGDLDKLENERDQGRCWFTKQVYRRCWDHCIRFILAYSIWYELATKNTQESGMSFP